jgi:hypothetical protein
MSIANELSSDVATAMLSRKDSETEPDTSELAGTVIEVHSTLRRMTRAARRKKLHPQESPADESLRSNNAASGN